MKSDNRPGPQLTPRNGPPTGRLPLAGEHLQSSRHERQQPMPSTLLHSRAAEERVYQNPSLSSQHMSFPQAHSPASLKSHTVSEASRSSPHTGRRELWDDPALGTHGISAQPRFESTQVGRSQASRTRSPLFQKEGDKAGIDGQAQKEDQQHTAQKTDNADDGHKGGCCKCIVM